MRLPFVETRRAFLLKEKLTVYCYFNPFSYLRFKINSAPMIPLKKTILYFALLLLTKNLTAQNIQLASSQGTGIESGGKMTRDDNGNIYCFGTFTDTLRLSNTLFAFSNGNFDCYIIKFNRYM